MSTLLLAALGLPAAATTYVDDDADPGGDGSAARPLASIQDAVDAADAAEDILVAEGTYTPFVVSSREVHLYGGYDAGFSAAGPDTPSVVQGTPDGPVVTLYEVGDSVLDGFVLRGGQRGLYIDAYWSSTVNRPVVSRNVIEQNGAPDVIGGGVFADHCDPTFVGNTIRDNVGDRGAGLAASCNSLVIDGDVVERNVGYGDHGGGLYMTGPTITLRDNLVRDNEIGVIAGYGWGAGALVFEEGTAATFERNVFTGNHAESVGGGAFVDDGAVATFDHDLFYANACSSQGGAALYVDGYSTEIGSQATLSHVTIADHHCPGAVGNAVYAEEQSVVTLVNSVVWDNGGSDFATLDTSTVSATYTLSEDGLDGEGNLSADPLFADPDAGDFHVRSTKGRYEAGEWVQDGEDSPTIDVGDPAAAYDLEPGPNGLRANLGHTGNTDEASMGAPGGVPPADADDPRRGRAESCGCAGVGGRSLVAVPLVAAWLRRRSGPARARR